jgi:hypothetical protein
MKIPTDIKISTSFVAVLLLGFVPVIAIWLPEVLMIGKAIQGEQRTDAKRP